MPEQSLESLYDLLVQYGSSKVGYKKEQKDIAVNVLQKHRKLNIYENIVVYKRKFYNVSSGKRNRARENNVDESTNDIYLFIFGSTPLSRTLKRLALSLKGTWRGLR